MFPSYAALYNTMSHGNKPEFDMVGEYPEWWNWYVKKQTQVMKRFYDVLLEDCVREGKNPLYIVRYEDLVLKPKETLMGLFGFLLGVRDLSGTNAERRIDQVLAMGRKATISYNLKPTTGQLNTHEDKYTPQLR